MATPEITLGDRIRRARLAAGLEKREVAAALGVTEQSVGQWELDRSRPRDLLRTLKALGELTGVDPDWIAGFVRTGSRCLEPSDTSDGTVIPDSLADMDPESRARARHPTASRSSGQSADRGRAAVPA